MKGIYIQVLLIVSLYSSNAQQFAPAPTNNLEDCSCQCIALSYYDEYGRQQGNCRSTVNGAQWCYVENDRYSTCPDLRPSQRYRGRYYSNHACVTLPAYSPECLGIVVYNGGNSNLQDYANVPFTQTKSSGNI